uniref:Putative mitotic checkpoint serine/threonine protein kinase n=1 Tax=Culex tarsalis TaxID=7177 RepID=A0A1Q3EY46_CULTA
MEQLEMVLTASDGQLKEEQRAHEERIQQYDGPDPLQPWYEYICWIEQTHPASSKQGANNAILLKCIAKFENDERYQQDHRFIKLCMKYIDTQSSPQELYQELYDRGIGTLCAELYIGWAYYYDAEDNFSQTEAIYQKGLDAGAVPKQELEQAHKQFGFSMSQRLLHKDEGSKQKFQSKLAERRNALTSLKGQRNAHVGSIRTGLAVRSYNPGIVKQENVSPNGNSSYAVPVFTGAGNSSKSVAAPENQSIVRSFVNASRDRENVREPGPWSDAKSSKKRGPLFGASHGPRFEISEDSVEFIPIPVQVENLSRGIQLEANHKRTNYPQKPFEIAPCDDDKPSGFPLYDKTFLYCRGLQEDFCPEELRGYRYFKRRGIRNQMTDRYDPIWANGAEAGIRLHPYHVREFKCDPKNDLQTDHPAVDSSWDDIQTRIRELYAAPVGEELSMEELRLQKWKEGKIKRYIDKKHDDDMLRVDMDETVVQSKRVSFAPARGSIMPPAQMDRKPVTAAPDMLMICEEQPDEQLSVAMPSSPPKTLGALRKSDKRRSEESPALKSAPKKPSMDEEDGKDDKEAKDFVAPKPKAKVTIPIFVDDETEPVYNKESNDYYPNETCSTQVFNMFVKSQSTPLGMKSGARSSQAQLPRQQLLLEEMEEPAVPLQDENLAQMQQMKTSNENAEPESLTPSTSNSTQVQKQLSTIMERTETSTISGACSTKSSVSSPPLGEVASPMIPSDQEQSVNHTNVNMKQAVKNLSTMPVEPLSTFKVPEEPSSDAPKPASISPFVIHIDSTETMAKIPLVAKSALPPKLPIEDKENLELPEPIPVPDEVTATTTTTSNLLLRKNLSHLPQREPVGVNSIMSFKMTTERTNTVPLPLIKQPPTENAPAPAPAVKQIKADDSLFELLVRTPSPKPAKTKTPPMAEKQSEVAGKNSSFFDLADFQKTPEKKSQNVPNVISNVQAPTSDNPQPLKIQSVMGAINLEDFPSPPKRGSIEDMNTEIFSLGMNKMKNSTLLPGRFTEFELPDKVAGVDISPPSGHQKAAKLEPLHQLDFDISMSESKLKQMALSDEKAKKKQDADGFKVPAPVFKSPPPIIDLDDDEEDDGVDLGKSIYVAKPASPVEVRPQWEEIDEYFNPANNEYMRKEVDLDGTMQFIYQQTNSDAAEIDPFDPKLQEAFLEKMDFMSYIEELSTCCLVNKVQPLAKGMIESVNEVKFSVTKKIGEGTFGTVYSAKNLTTGEQVAMKQERPANLWEYYICLELRARINHDEILPGLMSVDYAIVGNNASVLVSQFSRFGNILDVANLIKRVTTKNIDEFIAMIITAQILSIIDHLHSCMIIHADIKPDNFLLMTPINMNSNIPCVQLIDFGVSIDLKLFPKRTTFKKIVTTECFTCIEMLEKRPWTYQPDLYGVAGTTHVMLFGKYMEVQKDIINWNIKARMPRYFRKALWDNYFVTLLNIRDCSEMPNLQTLRGMLLAEIEENDKYIRDKVNEFNQALLSA